LRLAFSACRCRHGYLSLCLNRGEAGFADRARRVSNFMAARSASFLSVPQELWEWLSQPPRS